VSLGSIRMNMTDRWMKSVFVVRRLDDVCRMSKKDVGSDRVQ